MSNGSLKAKQIQPNGHFSLHRGLVNSEWQRLNQSEHRQSCTTSSEAIFSDTTANLLEAHRQNVFMGKLRQESKTQTKHHPLNTLSPSCVCYRATSLPLSANLLLHRCGLQQSLKTYSSLFLIISAPWSFKCLRNTFQPLKALWCPRCASAACSVRSSGEA